MSPVTVGLRLHANLAQFQMLLPEGKLSERHSLKNLDL